MITLYFNDTSLDVHESEESYRYRSIMGEHSLTLKFSLPGYIEFPIGTWCEYMAVKYTLEVPANFKKHGNRNFSCRAYRFSWEDTSSVTQWIRGSNFPCALHQRNFLKP